MPEIHTSPAFNAWRSSLAGDARTRIMARLKNMRDGNFGDCRPVGGRVSECRIHHGPGYRLYYTRIGETVYMLLVGGSKSTQQRDIRNALSMASQLEKGSAS